jgi:hypothetical protein
MQYSGNIARLLRVSYVFIMSNYHSTRVSNFSFLPNFMHKLGFYKINLIRRTLLRKAKMPF